MPTSTPYLAATGFRAGAESGERGEDGHLVSVDAGAIALLPLPSVTGLAEVADDDLLARLASAESAARTVTVVKAQLVAEIARRSSVAAGHAGLAARFGERSPERFVQRLIGVSPGEARALVETGSMMAGVEAAGGAGADAGGVVDAGGGAAASGGPCLLPIVDAVQRGSISVGGAAAISRGLGEPIDGVSAETIAEATERLVEFASRATPEEVAIRARAVRDELDEHAVADRERLLRSQRSLTWHVLPNGATRAVAICDPESWAIVRPVLEAATAVAREHTEVRFMSDAERRAVVRPSRSRETGRTAAGNTPEVEPRTIDQARLDALVDIAELASRSASSDLDPQKILGDRSTGVRVHVDASDLATGTGSGHLEGEPVAVSIATVTRLVCSSGILPVLFAGATAIDVGQRQRLHSPRQRVALAATWGGCAWPGCDRPEYSCEIHHIEPWNGENTTLANGIPLCRFHHVELHANGWTLTRGPEVQEAESRESESRDDEPRDDEPREPELSDREARDPDLRDLESRQSSHPLHPRPSQQSPPRVSMRSSAIESRDMTVWLSPPPGSSVPARPLVTRRRQA